MYHVFIAVKELPEPEVPDPCSPNPCNGTQQCNVTESGGYNCTCPPGYKGEHCDVGKYWIKQE